MSRVQVPSFAHFHSRVMTYLEALILGVIQGITEFFPVSSSAHLRIFKKLLSIPDGEHLLYFDLLCHAGTWLALLIYLRKEVLKILQNRQEIALFTLALLPLIPAYFFLKPIRIALSEPIYLGFFLFVTAAFLFQASRVQKKEEERTFKKALLIGMSQALALIPGISRSGSTIATARLCGWSFIEGAKFSFLLALPTILGGECLETIKLLSSHEWPPLVWPCYAIAFVSSFGVGLFSVQAVFWVYKRDLIRPLAWYCIGVGLLTLAIFHG